MLAEIFILIHGIKSDISRLYTSHTPDLPHPSISPLQCSVDPYMTRITQINHEWLNNIPMKSISVFRNRFDWAYRCNMHIAIVFPNHTIISINTHNTCITYCYPCTCTEVIYNYYITWRAIIYREIFRSRSTVSARPKGDRIPRSRAEYFPILPDRRNCNNKFII